jgi:predicted PurR-regulated permease PerM
MKPRQIVTVALFFILFSFMLYQTGRLLMPFAAPIMSAAVLGMLFYPMHLRIGKRLHLKNANAQAILSDLAVLAVCLGPAMILVLGLLSQTRHLMPLAREESLEVAAYVKDSSTAPIPILSHLPAKVQEKFQGKTQQIHDKIVSFSHAALQHASGWLREIFKDTVHAFTNIGVILFCLFFFFRDGPAMVNSLYRLFPMPAGTREMLNKSIVTTIVSVVRSGVLTSLAQGTAILIGLLIVRIHGALLLGVLSAFCSLIPVVGNTIVWIPVTIYLLVSGAVWKGIFFLVWCVVILGSLEQFLRPLLIQDTGELPLLWLALSMMGGMEVFGARGALLGPVILGAMTVLFQIYEKHFLRED